MELFDKKFVHFMWDDSLEGKVGFFSDCIDTLITRVDDNIRETIDKQQVFGPCTHGVNAYPFSIKDVSHRFFYYDSLYKYKLAYKQGKKVEVFGFVGISRAWIEVTEAWKWDENYQYRVKPEMWTVCISDEGEVSIMPAGKWNKSKGKQLIEGTEEECSSYALEHYCKKCIHESSMCCCPNEERTGFKKHEEAGCNTCSYKGEPGMPCSTCRDGSNYKPRVIVHKKRRMTNSVITYLCVVSVR